METQVDAYKELMPPREMKWSESVSNWQVWVHRDKTRSSLDIRLHCKIIPDLFASLQNRSHKLRTKTTVEQKSFQGIFHFLFCFELLNICRFAVPLATNAINSCKKKTNVHGK